MIIALIPAKKNSTRIIGKNMKLLKKKPLFQYSIEAARKSKFIKKIFVSSDDDKILSLTKRLNCEAISRPKKLSKNNTPINHVIMHFIEYLKKKEIFATTIGLLQPTSPIRENKILDKLINKYSRNKKTLVTVKKDNNKYLKDIIKYSKKVAPVMSKYFNSNDQELPLMYIPNGSVYIFSVKKFLKEKSIPIKNLIIYEMFDKFNINIDTIEDFKNAKKKI